LTGLTSDEASHRLEKFGPNAVPDTAMHPLRRALTKFWAPVPWMLEAAIVLEVVLGKYVEAGIIAILLALNAVLGFFQEGRAQATLAVLKSRLALNVSVRRDNVWASVPATELVPGDVVKLSLGAVVAADVRLTEGQILLDQSMLTGESVPIEAGPGLETYAGALVRRGDPSLAKEVAEQLMRHDALGAHARDELGISETFRARPIQAASASAGSFAVGAAMPLMATAMAPTGNVIAIVTGTSLVILALLGGLAARAGGAGVTVGALRVTFWGALAMALTAGIGALVGTVV
jgi:magnesium-transporting ATPase (P-type)